MSGTGAECAVSVAEAPAGDDEVAAAVEEEEEMDDVATVDTVPGVWIGGFVPTAAGGCADTGSGCDIGVS